MPKSITNYTEERKDVLDRLLNILEVTKTNNMLSLKKLDESIDKQKMIMELEEDIKRYFLCSKWSYFNNKDRKMKRVYLSLIKMIMKDMNVTMTTSTLVTKTKENIKKYETYYIISV